jgi:hypothetical protein
VTSILEVMSSFDSSDETAPGFFLKAKACEKSYFSLSANLVDLEGALHRAF